MKTVTQHLYDHFYSSVGFYPTPSIDQLSESEWSFEYEHLRRNRMIMGAFRYGLLDHQPLDKYNDIKEAQRKLALFNSDHNLEHLVDAGNLIMIAFIKGQKLGYPFQSTDDQDHKSVGASL